MSFQVRILGFAIGLLSLGTCAWCQDDLVRLYSEAQQAQAAGDFQTASIKYEAIIKLRPQMAEAYANLGNLYYQQGRTDRAKSVYTKATQLKPELPGPYFFLGVIAFGERDYKTAVLHLEHAKALQPSNTLIHSYLGYTHYARSAYVEAARELEKAAALDGTDIDVLYHLSKSYGHLAGQSYSDLQTRFPDSVYTALSRAHVYETSEDWKAAGAQYRLALSKMPDSKRIQEKVQWTEGKVAGAGALNPGTNDELIDGSLVYRDSSPSGPKLREEVLRSKSRVQELLNGAKGDKNTYLIAESYQVLSFLTSLEIFEADPDSYRSHELRAQLLEESKNDDGAIEEYRNVLNRKPDLQNIHFAIGSLYWKQQRFNEARPELEAELKMNPNHPQALYELGDLCAFAGDTRSAEKYLLGALKFEPRMIEAHFALEKIYTQRGRLDLSIEQLQQALQINPSNPTAHYRLAQIYRKLGRTQDADRELAIFNRSQTAAK